MIRNTLVLMLVALASAASTSGVLGAPKPNPDPVSTEPPDQPDMGKWAAAYERAGRPTVLVLCGRATGAQQAPDPGNALWNLDPSGATTQFKAAFEQIINDPQADIELVNYNALQAAVQRNGALLDIRNEREAIKLLARDLSAQLVIVIQLFGEPAPGTKVNVEAFDAARARTRFQTPFDWKLGSSTRDLKINARALARAFIDDYARRAEEPSARLTVRVLGAGLREDQQGATQAFRSVAGVSHVRRRNASVGGRDATIEFEVTHDADADPGDVVMDLAAALEHALDASVLIVKEEGSAAMLRVGPRAAQVVEFVPSCTAAILTDLDRGKELRRELGLLYKAKNSPRVAVMVNRRPTPREQEQLAGQGGAVAADNIIVIASAGRDAAAIGGGAAVGPGRHAAPDPDRGNRRIDGDEEFYSPTDLENVARSFEHAISERFNQTLDFTTISPEVARGRVAASIDKERKVMGQQELVELIRTLNIADVVIFGVGTLPDRRRERVASFTFTAVNMADALQLGFGKAAGEISIAAPQDAIDLLAEEAVCELACTMMKNWRPPSRLEVMVHNATDFGDYDIIRQAIGTHTRRLWPVGSGIYERGTGQGVIRFVLEYNCPTDELHGEFARLSGHMPFRLSVLSMTANACKLDIQRR